MSELEDAAAFSSLMAPIVDRIAISVHNAVDKNELAALRGDHKFHPGALALFAGLLVAGPVAADEFAELTRYQHFAPTSVLLEGLAQRGAIVLADDFGFTATPDAVAVSKGVVELQAKAVTSLFSPLAARLPGLWSLVERAHNAAVADPNSLLSRLFDRSWLPDDATDAAKIWNSCVLLRMHRSDAHAMAWKEAGLTVQQIREMAPSPERMAIEVRTNQLAAAPWAGLAPSERLTLVAGLGALPGVGSPI